MTNKSLYMTVKELLLCEFNIDFVRCQVSIGNNSQADKYMLMRTDYTLAYPQPVTIDSVIEWLKGKGYSVTDYE